MSEAICHPKKSQKVLKYALVLGLSLSVILFLYEKFTPQPLPAPVRSPSIAEDFQLLDHQGRAHDLYRKADARAVVLISQQNGDPGLVRDVSTLKKLQDDWEKEKVEFLMINATGSDTRQAIGEELQKNLLNLPVLIDDSQIISRALGLTVTPQALVLWPQDKWKISFRGPISELGAALRTSEPSRSVPAQANAMLIPYLPTHEITYESVAPILIARCLSCHVEGMYRPDNWRSYEQVSGWGAMIRETIRKRMMPPWNADPMYGKFRNDTSMTVNEMRTIVSWIEQGMPRGEGVDPLENEQPVESRRNGERVAKTPDLVLSMEHKITIPAQGFLKYQYYPVGKVFTEDIWIKALKLESQSPGLLHHASMIIVPKHLVAQLFEESKKSEGEGRKLKAAGRMAFMTDEQVVKVLLWAPGKTHLRRFGKGIGVKIEKGSQVVLELHHVGSGKEEEDKVSVKAFYHQDSKGLKRVLTLLMRNQKFTVPPRVKDYIVQTSPYELRRDIGIISYLPHMHMRGRSIRTTAQYPDGKREILISIPDYDFNWQKGFVLQETKRIPKGTRLWTEGSYDNSATNPANPDPDSPSSWGQQSEINEMLNMNINYVEL